MIELKGDGPVPLLLGYHEGAQRVDRSTAEKWTKRVS